VEVIVWVEAGIAIGVEKVLKGTTLRRFKSFTERRDARETFEVITFSS
jgi:hypothetical protein